MKRLFKNNTETVTVDNIIGSGDTILLSSTLTIDIFSGMEGDELYIATFTDGIDLEIIYIRPDGFDYLMERGMEATTSLEWPIGTTIQLRITSGSLTSFLQDGGSEQLTHTKHLTDIENTIGIARKNSSNWSASATVGFGTVLLDGPNTYYYLDDGTTNPTAPPSPTEGLWDVDGDAPYIFLTGVNTAPYRAGTMLGSKSYSSSSGAIAIGGDTSTGPVQATGYECIAIGGDIRVVGEYAIGIGNEFSSYEPGSIVIGNSVSSFMKGGLVTGCVIPEKPISPIAPIFDSTALSRKQTNLSGILWSSPIDFAGGATWGTITSAGVGSIVKPVTPNGYQYIRVDQNYDPIIHTLVPGSYTPGITGVSEPTWPTTQGDTVNDGDGDWVTLPNSGYTLLLPENFVVEEVGILIFEYSSISVQPIISVGKTGATTLFVNNQLTTGLTAANKSQRFVILNTEAVDNLVITINTLATGTKLLGQVYFKGFYVRHWR